ncbi:translation initiation factor 4E [Entomortierella parvispora]|uniref:Translation initiation factor 4E n=1 Tax=Entomortierella parvispora TaxID=205924 RepID=A0A9P3H435_9FUNG|nr:translation initiation factor 4E [Entomortierella parvispora]
MSASASAADAVGLPHGQGTPSSEGRAASPAPGPWRASSRTGRSSPAPPASGLFKDSDPRPSSSSSPSTSTSTGGAWVSPSARGVTPTTNTPASSSEQGPSSHEQSEVRAFGSPARTSSYTASANRGLSAGTPSHGVSTPPVMSAMKMEDLAAKFSSKEKHPSVQLSPALSASSSFHLGDKERRAPSAFGTPGSTHMAHIKVQRTASLTGSPQPSPVGKGLGGKTQSSHLSQGTDMRRTASHNNAFSSGLGSPVLSNGAHMDSTGSSVGGSSNGQSSHAPFSLATLSRSSPRRSSLNPQEPSSSGQGDHASASSSVSAAIADKLPLQHPWTLYFDTTSAYNRQGSSQSNFESGLREIGSFTTVKRFAEYFNWIIKPHKIENSSNYHLFKDGIKPMWEDPANSKGGRWILTLLTKNPELLDRCWMELAYALVGEQLDAGDDICGAVLSRRTKADRLAVWVREKDNVDAVNGIGKRLIRLLDLAKEKISLEFQITSDSRSSNTARDYISLDAIRQELASETAMMNGSAAAVVRSDATPGLSSDSLFATPASAASSSPATPADHETDSGLTIKVDSAPSDEGEGLTESNTSGLLISMDGGRSSLTADGKEGSY